MRCSAGPTRRGSRTPGSRRQRPCSPPSPLTWSSRRGPSDAGSSSSGCSARRSWATPRRSARWRRSSIALVAAAAVRLVSGTSAGRPTVGAVAGSLAELGVRGLKLEEAERQVAGVFHVRGVDDDGRPLLVKVYGRDAYDTQLVSRLWRRVWYRGSGPAVRLSRLHAAEHEAFVTLLSRSAGLASHDVVTAGATIDDDALLVLRGDGRPLASLDPARLDDATLRRAWTALALLDRLADRAPADRPDHHGRVLGRGRIRRLRRRSGRRERPSAHGRPGSAPDDDGRTRRWRASAVAAAIGALGPGRGRVPPPLPPGRRLGAGAPARAEGRRGRCRRAAHPGCGGRRRRAAGAWSSCGASPSGRSRSWRCSCSRPRPSSRPPPTSTGAQVRDRLRGRFVGVDRPRPRPRPAPAADAGARHARLGAGAAPARPRLRAPAGDRLHERRAAVEPRAHGGQHPLLPAPGPLGADGGRLGRDRLVREHDRAGGPARPAAPLLGSDARPRPARPHRRGARTCSGSSSARWPRVALVLVLLRRLRRALVELVRRWWPDVRRALAALRASHKLALLLLGSVATEVLFAIALGVCARGVRLRPPARGAAGDQHQRLAARQLHPRAGRHRRRRVRSRRRADVGGHDARRQRSPPSCSTAWPRSTSHRSGASSPCGGCSATATSEVRAAE